MAEPLSIHVHTYNTSEKSEKELLEIINNNFDLRPGAIIRLITHVCMTDTMCFDNGLLIL